MGITRELAEFIYETNFNDLPHATIEKGKHCILDWLGVALAGLQDPASE